MKPRLVVFDLDGTLIDSSAWLLQAVNQVLAPYVSRPWTLDDLLATAGGPEREVFSHVVPAEALERVLAQYRVALGEPGSLRIQPGVEEMLAALDAHGIATAIFSGAGRKLGELRLSLVGWSGRFAVRVWGDQTAPKPAPDGLLRCLGQAGVALPDAVFVGDTEKDSLCAQAAGVRFIGVAWGDRAGVIEGCEEVAAATRALVEKLVGPLPQ